jgi:hypothetical protein
MIVGDDEYLDFKSVPESKGIPPALVRVAAVGLVIIFLIGASVCLMSGFGHHWPADTTLHVPLNNDSR